MGAGQLLACLVASTVIISAHCQYTAEQIKNLTLKGRKLPNDICGRSASIAKKILNGEPADLGAYPWMAALGYPVRENVISWSCGGTLISDQYVLTAAHCLVMNNNYRPRLITMVRLADLDLDDSKIDMAPVEDVPVEKTVWHPQYNSDTKTNDIGLVKLQRKVAFKILLNPICLPSVEVHLSNLVGRSTLIAGWGRTSSGRGGYDITALQEASVQIKDLNECRTNLTSVIPNATIDDRNVCALGKNLRGVIDTCQGDSGSPMMFFYRDRDGIARMYVYGIVSYGYICAQEGYPGVYTRVSMFFAWILETMDI